MLTTKNSHLELPGREHNRHQFTINTTHRHQAHSNSTESKTLPESELNMLQVQLIKKNQQEGCRWKELEDSYLSVRNAAWLGWVLV